MQVLHFKNFASFGMLQVVNFSIEMKICRTTTTAVAIWTLKNHSSFIHSMWRKISFIFNDCSPEPDRIYEKRRRYDEYVVEKKHSAQLLGNKLKDLNCSNRAEEAKEIVKPGLLIIPPDDIVFVVLVQCLKSMQCISEPWRIEIFALWNICWRSWMFHIFSKLKGVFRFGILYNSRWRLLWYVRNKRKQLPNFKQSKGRWQIFWEHFDGNTAMNVIIYHDASSSQKRVDLC